MLKSYYFPVIFSVLIAFFLFFFIFGQQPPSLNTIINKYNFYLIGVETGDPMLYNIDKITTKTLEKSPSIRPRRGFAQMEDLFFVSILI